MIRKLLILLLLCAVAAMAQEPLDLPQERAPITVENAANVQEVAHFQTRSPMAVSPYDLMAFVQTAQAGDQVVIYDLAADTFKVLELSGVIVSIIEFNPVFDQNVALMAISTLSLETGIGEVQLWDAFVGDLRYSIPIEEGAFVMDMAFSVDGTQLAIAAGDPLNEATSVNLLQIVDTATGELIGEPVTYDAPISNLAFMADGSLLVQTRGGVYMQDGTPLFENEANGLWGEMLVSGTTLIIGVNDDPATVMDAVTSVQIWDVVSGEILNSITPKVGITALGLGPDGTILVIASGDYMSKNTITLYDISDGTELASFENRLGATTDILFSADGSLIIYDDHDPQSFMNSQIHILAVQE